MSSKRKTKEELKKELSPDAYHVTQEKGTERPHTGEYNLHFENGKYHCICCDAVLFHSEDKFDAGCGWPSFTQPSEEQALTEQHDPSLPGRPRTEVVCNECGAHLGHVFPDGPPEKTGLRYCINSVALKFKKK